MRIFAGFLLIGILLLSCKKDESDVFRPMEAGFQGLVQKGPFISGSSIVVQELNEDFIPNGKVYHTTTQDDFGAFALKGNITTPYVEIIAQGFYFNEISGQLSSANLSLRTLVKVEENLISNINVLTTLSKDRIIHLVENEGVSFEEAKVQASGELLKVFGIIGSESDFDTMDISSTSEGGAILLAVSAIVQGNNSVAELSEYISKFILDFTVDGILDSQDLNDHLKNNATLLNLKSVRSIVEQRYNSLGHNIVVPNFEIYAKRLVDLKILQIYPEKEQVDLPLNSEVMILFNKRLNGASINNASITISLNGEPVPGSLAYSESDYVVTFSPNVLFEPSSKYDVGIKTSITASDGIALPNEFVGYFTTESFDITSDLTNHYVFTGSSDDSSGNMNTAVFSNVTYTEDMGGTIGQAIAFRGNGHYIDLPRSINPVQSEWSFSIWFKLDQLPSDRDDAFLLTQKNHNNESDIYLYVDDEDNMIKTGIASSRSKISSGVSVSKDVWYQCSITYTSEALHIYVNGELMATSNKKFTSSNSSSEEFRIACDWIDSWYGYDEDKGRIFGSVDNVRIYDRKLNGREVLELYETENSTNPSGKIISNIGSPTTVQKTTNSWH